MDEQLKQSAISSLSELQAKGINVISVIETVTHCFPIESQNDKILVEISSLVNEIRKNNNFEKEKAENP